MYEVTCAAVSAALLFAKWAAPIGGAATEARLDAIRTESSDAWLIAGSTLKKNRPRLLEVGALHCRVLRYLPSITGR
ncbi:hypothetical protein F7R13_07730 [Burkholderia territorii]|uniref:Uncharacterized protein n=1 Tax=Burkholderia territorii TaxID=1503055 RepID=A0A6L3NL27_9BURK|nr:hypothetical protein [Burkholderia territorii]KAB0684677.1 hypothetical protein F7R13_07730 [Burkholderia territorii]